MDFLFFSKLLPLFFYPLGLACLLVIIALIIWWKFPRFTPIPLVFAVLILLVSSNVWFSNWLLKSLEWQYIANPDDLPKAEAIVILGGCTKSATYPRPMVDVSEHGDRVIYGAKLYQLEKAPIIVASGGRIKWLGGGGEKSEADDISQLLTMLGVPESAIIKETESLNTYQNAVNTRQILASLNIQRILLVTSAFHMPRSVKIFEKQNLDVIPAPTDFIVSKSNSVENNNLATNLLNFLPDSQNLEHTTLAIKEYVGIAVYKLKGWL